MAEKLPAITFYPGDWLRDAVAGCSLAAQALWLRMMFIAHDSTRYGYLEVNGSPMQPETIARRCGCDLAQYETLLSELVAAGVPSRSESGSLFSRRMVRDASIRDKRRKAGRRGGCAPRSKLQANDNQNTENENESEGETENEFEMFWSVFPRGRKKSKSRARDSWIKAIEKVDPATIIAAAAAYAESDAARGQYVQMPSTWLNGECWNDDREAWRNRDADSLQQGYREISVDEFNEYSRLQSFKEAPRRHAINPRWVFGTLRDGSKVECKNYPPAK